LNFSYDGNKLNTISGLFVPDIGQTETAKFTYNGNLIVKIEYFNKKTGSLF
jgi:hypothetical protein